MKLFGKSKRARPSLLTPTATSTRACANVQTLAKSLSVRAFLNLCILRGQVCLFTSCTIYVNKRRSCWLLHSADSLVNGVSVHASRREMGVMLGKSVMRMIENGEMELDCVIPVPETSRTMAISLAHHLQAQPATKHVMFSEGKLSSTCTMHAQRAGALCFFFLLLLWVDE